MYSELQYIFRFDLSSNCLMKTSRYGRSDEICRSIIKTEIFLNWTLALHSIHDVLFRYVNKDPKSVLYCEHEVKKEEIWLSPMTKAPTPTEKSKKQRDNTKSPPKTSITQRLRTDLGRSVGVTIATQLVWLNRFTGSKPSHLPQKLCNQKDTHLKFCK